MRKFYQLGISLSFYLIFFAYPGFGQVKFSKGVNFSTWFQVSGAHQIPFSKFTKQDFLDVKSLGCDVIRLPINMHDMTSGSPDYTLDPLLLTFLDTVVNWAEQTHMALLLDNHSSDPSGSTPANVGTILTKVWTQMAHHFKDRSLYIYYEVLNEPHDITTEVWGGIQQEVIDAIRKEDTKHTIVVGPSGYNSYNELKKLPVYADNNLLYTFHFYDPFLFTHQGATWVSPSMADLTGVPFPYDAARMPVCPASLKGSWVENSLTYSYPTDGTPANVTSLLDIAVDFKNTRNVPVFCGEFGVFMQNSNNNDRVAWYSLVHSYLEEKGIPWTMWDYRSGFGLFKKGSNELFNYDVNIPLVQALGFVEPDQLLFVPKADSVGFPLYRDAIEPNIEGGTGGDAFVDFYGQDYPDNGNFCIGWTGATQYSYIGFDFKPDKDLSKLQPAYALDFMVRGDTPGTRFVVRFIDTKTTDVNDHPWRMVYTIQDDKVSWDKKWHHLHIPLSSFTEQGSWDNKWYDPVGNFDWKAVDRFDITDEYGGLTGKKFWFDNIHITNLDTAIVRFNGTLNNAVLTASDDYGLKISPNPVFQNTLIEYNLPQEGLTTITIYNLQGQRVYTIADAWQKSGNHAIAWNTTDKPNQISNGVYLCCVTAPGYQKCCKLIVIK